MSKTDGGFAYDAVWAIALALKMTEEHLRRLNPSQSIVNFTYVNEDIMKQFKSYLNKTQFQGLTVSTKHSWIFFILSEFHNGQVHQVLEENRNP